VIVTAPVCTPVTTPSREPTVAVDVADDVHRPPGGISVSEAVAATHTEEGPLIAPGDGLTVTTVVPMHPPVDVYVITVVPVSTPHTAPVVDTTVATDVRLLIHVPPMKPTGNVSRIDAPMHTADGPPITGTALTVIVTLPVIVFVQPVITFFAVIVYAPAVD